MYKNFNIYRAQIVHMHKYGSIGACLVGKRALGQRARTKSARFVQARTKRR